VAGYIPRWFAQPKTVTHPSINRARRRVTTLIDSNALLLCQTTKVGNRVGQITRGYADIAQFPCDRLSSIRMSFLVYTAIVPHYARLQCAGFVDHAPCAFTAMQTKVTELQNCLQGTILQMQQSSSSLSLNDLLKKESSYVCRYRTVSCCNPILLYAVFRKKHPLTFSFISP